MPWIRSTPSVHAPHSSDWWADALRFGSEMIGMAAASDSAGSRRLMMLPGWVVSFLASQDAAYITGQSIVVDGGMWFS